jgi:hypothetical protein
MATSAKTVTSTMLSSIAITMGVLAFFVAGIKGHGAGWEEMFIYAIPAAVSALLALAIRRSKLTYLALGGGALGVLGLLMGW